MITVTKIIKISTLFSSLPLRTYSFLHSSNRNKRAARFNIFRDKNYYGHRPTEISSSSSTTAPQQEQPQAKPRTGFLQGLLNIALSSQIWKLVLVPLARQKIVDTGEANGIPWTNAFNWIQSQDGPWKDNIRYDTSHIEPYYKKPFHAYEDGNLCWEAALEQEIAGRAVGARNFPLFGEDGEDAFRNAFVTALNSIGASVPDDAIILDLGCGTGTSTRQLAALYPQAKSIIGLDLSPYFINVGKKLLELAPESYKDGGNWVTTIKPDNRIELKVGDATSIDLPDNSIDIISLNLVIHELPPEITLSIVNEAYRVLKKDGQMWINEMDYDSPAFSNQRSNALLFSLIRSTEPFLDVYADNFRTILDFMKKKYDLVRITAATGRHFSMIGFKKQDSCMQKNVSDDLDIEDTRFFSDGRYRVDDTHLTTWENERKN